MSWMLPITAVDACGGFTFPIYEASVNNLHKSFRAPRKGEPTYMTYYFNTNDILDIQDLSDKRMNLQDIVWGIQKGISVWNIQFVRLFSSFVVFPGINHPKDPP